jgi:hypothetical protein
LLGEGAYGACCGDACIDLGQDPNNCGQCGNVCASGVCAFNQLGACLPTGSEGDCLMSCGGWPFICFEGSCVRTDCPPVGGIPLPVCRAENGTIGFCCDTGACAHPLDDPQNCGSCGNVCPSGQSCVNGSCTGFPGCGLGHMFWFCGDAGDENHVCCPAAGCTDLVADSSNCGGCGNVCPPALVCVDGVCGSQSATAP